MELINCYLNGRETELATILQFSVNEQLQMRVIPPVPYHPLINCTNTDIPRYYCNCHRNICVEKLCPQPCLYMRSRWNIQYVTLTRTIFDVCTATREYYAG